MTEQRSGDNFAEGRYRGYEQTASRDEDPELTHVGPGTPCGEYMRRFWQPVAMAEELADLPVALRILGEELVLFRDLGGRLGLVHKHCPHRGTSLEYGIVAEKGIRCCYHGWLIDIDGSILDTPGEPEGSPIKDKVCHGAYPVREYKGLIFAYLGALENLPPFPLFDTYDLPGTEMVPYAIDYPCNWLQVAENPMDPFHSVFLHTRSTRAHFNPAWGALPKVRWRHLPDQAGIYLTNTRRWQDYIWIRTAEVFAPNFAQPPDIYQNPDQEKFFPRVGISKFTLPVDNENCRIIAWRHFSPELDLGQKGDRNKVGLNKVDFVGQTGVERSFEEGKRMPGDYEAQVSQGRITSHRSENLGTTDRGVSMYRQFLRQGIRALQKGDGPQQPPRNADGLIPTTAGDVIVKVAPRNDEEELLSAWGKAVGEIVVETLPLGHQERREEITRRVRALQASGAG